MNQKSHLSTGGTGSGRVEEDSSIEKSTMNVSYHRTNVALTVHLKDGIINDKRITMHINKQNARYYERSNIIFTHLLSGLGLLARANVLGDTLKYNVIFMILYDFLS